jgi:DNA helicase-2/ATP-dependent DNA helicase PcrA
VGDDAQSIYSFRGAKIENILNFRNDYPGYNTYKLEQNYRSTQTIVNAANSVIAKNKNQIHKTVFSNNESGDKIKVLNALTDNEEGYLVVGEIVDKRMQNQNNYSDFAILYRTNAQSRIFEEALRKRNIPYKIYGGLSFYQRKEIKDLLAYYRLIINHKDGEAFKRVVNYPTRGIGTTTLNKLEQSATNNGCSIWEIASSAVQNQQAGLNSGASKKVLDFCKLISDFATSCNNNGAYEIAMQVASDTGILKELYNDKSPENITRYENIQELLNAIQEFSISAKEEDRSDSLSIFMEDVALTTDQDNDKEENTDKVTLMTVHSSKGLEFKNVFIVGLEEKLFPSGFSGTITPKELEEERRLFYVAITRAESCACLSFARQRYRWGNLEFCNPSRFIGEIDDSFLDFQGADNSDIFTSAPQQTNRSSSEKGFSSYKTTKSYQPQRGSKIGQVAMQRTIKNNISSNTASFVGDDPDEIVEGIYVVHQRFGRGKVMGIEGEMPDKKAKVFFPNVGEKQLLLKFAKLKIED